MYVSEMYVSEMYVCMYMYVSERPLKKYSVIFCPDGIRKATLNKPVSGFEATGEEELRATQTKQRAIGNTRSQTRTFLPGIRIPGGETKTLSHERGKKWGFNHAAKLSFPYEISIYFMRF